MNYKVMSVFSNRTYICIHLTHAFGKFFTCTLQFCSECERSYPLTRLIMLSPRIITVFVCSGVLSFHAVVLGRLWLSLIDDCICLVWSWSDAREFLQLWFSLLILSLELLFTFLLPIFLPFVLLPIFPLSVWKPSLLFSIDSVISLIDSKESSTSGQSKSIFFSCFLTKIWFPLLREAC